MQWADYNCIAKYSSLDILMSSVLTLKADSQLYSNSGLKDVME